MKKFTYLLVVILIIACLTGCSKEDSGFDRIESNKDNYLYTEEQMFNIRKQAFLNGYEAHIYQSFTTIKDEFEFDSLMFVRFRLDKIKGFK